MEKIREAAKRAKAIRQRKEQEKTQLLVHIDEQQQKLITFDEEIKNVKTTLVGIHNSSIIMNNEQKSLINEVSSINKGLQIGYNELSHINKGLNAELTDLTNKMIEIESMYKDLMTNFRLSNDIIKIQGEQINELTLQKTISQKRYEDLESRFTKYEEYTSQIVEASKTLAQGYAIIGLDPRTMTADDVITTMTDVKEIIDIYNDEEFDENININEIEEVESDELTTLPTDEDILQGLKDSTNTEIIDTFINEHLEQGSDGQLNGNTDLSIGDDKTAKINEDVDGIINSKNVNINVEIDKPAVDKPIDQLCSKCKILPIDKFEMLIKMSIVTKLRKYEENPSLYTRYFAASDSRLVEELLNEGLIQEHLCNFNSNGYKVLYGEVYVGIDTYNLLNGKKNSLLNLMKKKGLLKNKTKAENNTGIIDREEDVTLNHDEGHSKRSKIESIPDNNVYSNYEAELSCDIYDLDDMDFDNAADENEQISTYEIRNNTEMGIVDLQEMLEDIIATANVDTIIKYNDGITSELIEHPLYRRPENYEGCNFRMVKHELDDDTFSIPSLYEIFDRIKNSVLETFKPLEIVNTFTINQFIHGQSQIKCIGGNIEIYHNPFYYLCTEYIGYCEGQKLDLDSLSKEKLPVSVLKQFIKRSYYGLMLNEGIHSVVFKHVINDYGDLRIHKNTQERNNVKKDINYIYDLIFGMVVPYNIRIYRKSTILGRYQSESVFPPNTIYQIMRAIREKGINFCNPSKSEYKQIKKGIGHIKIIYEVLFPMERPIEYIIVPVKFLLEQTINLGQVTKYKNESRVHISGVYTWAKFNMKTTKEMIIDESEIDFNLNYQTLDTYYDYISKVRNLRSVGLKIVNCPNSLILKINNKDSKITSIRSSVLQAINYDIAGLTEVECNKFDVGFRASHVFAKGVSYRAVVPHLS